MTQIFKEKHSNYFYTKENIRIFYSTNFDTKNYSEEQAVLVFNYGLVCNNAHWKYQLSYFDKLGFNILIHDYRCHYSSSQDIPIDTCNFDNIVDDINQLINSLNLKNIHMLGHSMGVNVTLEYAKQFPSEIESMTLISGTVFPPHDVMFDSNIVELLMPTIEYITTTFPNLFESIWKKSHLNPIVRNFVLKGGFNTEHVSKDFVEIYMKRTSDLPKEIFLHLMNLMKEHDIDSYLQDIDTKALLIGGDRDKIIPNYLQHYLNDQLSNSELYIVKDGSHVPQADFPDTINNRILAFLPCNK